MTTMEAWIVRARMDCHKLISQSKCRSFYDNDWGMNWQCTHELLSCHCQGLLFHRQINFYNFFSLWSTCNRTFYSFNMEFICTCVFYVQKLNKRSPKRTHAILIFFKTHSWKLIPYWTRKGSITYTKFYLFINFSFRFQWTKVEWMHSLFAL